MARQTAGIACAFALGRAQQLAQALGHRAEMHLGQMAGACLVKHSLQLGQLRAELVGVLRGRNDRYLQHLGHLRQAHCVGQHRRALVKGGHQPHLGSDQHQLAIGSVQQH